MAYHGTLQHLHALAPMASSWSEIHVEVARQLNYQPVLRYLIVEIVSTPKDLLFWLGSVIDALLKWAHRVL